MSKPSRSLATRADDATNALAHIQQGHEMPGVASVIAVLRAAAAELTPHYETTEEKTITSVELAQGKLIIPNLKPGQKGWYTRYANNYPDVLWRADVLDQVTYALLGAALLAEDIRGGYTSMLNLSPEDLALRENAYGWLAHYAGGDTPGMRLHADLQILITEGRAGRKGMVDAAIVDQSYQVLAWLVEDHEAPLRGMHQLAVKYSEVTAKTLHGPHIPADPNRFIVPELLERAPAAFNPLHEAAVQYAHYFAWFRDGDREGFEAVLRGLYTRSHEMHDLLDTANHRLAEEGTKVKSVARDKDMAALNNKVEALDKLYDAFVGMFLFIRGCSFDVENLEHLSPQALNLLQRTLSTLVEYAADPYQVCFDAHALVYDQDRVETTNQALIPPKHRDDFYTATGKLFHITDGQHERTQREAYTMYLTEKDDEARFGGISSVLANFVEGRTEMLGELLERVNNVIASRQAALPPRP